MKEKQNPITIEKGDTFEDVFSKYGCFALDKQENLGELIGDSEGELNIESRTLSFGDLEVPIQILGFFREEFNEWYWAWDNEDIGFPQEIIERSIQIKEIGDRFDIPEFSSPIIGTDFDGCHRIAMASISILDVDAYYAVSVDDLDIFVIMKSDLIPKNNAVEKFRDTYNLFQKNFDIDPRTALEGYTKLKGYIYKEKPEFSIIKIKESRIIVGFSENGRVTHIQTFVED